MYNTLLLSGGSVKGILTLGALQYLHENNYLTNITTYVGVSIGAIISYLLAIGYTPMEIIVFICSNGVFEKMQKTYDIISLINGSGVASYDAIDSVLRRMTIEKIGIYLTLEGLMKKYGKRLVCNAYNWTTRKQEVFTPETHPDLPCLTAIGMSACLPILFTRFKYNKCEYIDGGITDNFPISIAEKYGRVIGIIIYDESGKPPVVEKTGLLEYIYDILFIPVKENNKRKILNKSESTKIISVDDEELKIYNFSLNNIEKIQTFNKGYVISKNIMCPDKSSVNKPEPANIEYLPT
jgi:predicted acylesterase/phospholipase RssA